MSRSIKRSDEDIPVPPLVKSAALWGAYNNAPLLFSAVKHVICLLLIAVIIINYLMRVYLSFLWILLIGIHEDIDQSLGTL